MNETLIESIKKEIKHAEWSINYHTNQLEASTGKKAALEAALAQLEGKDEPEADEWETFLQKLRDGADIDDLDKKGEIPDRFHEGFIAPGAPPRWNEYAQSLIAKLQGEQIK